MLEAQLAMGWEGLTSKVVEICRRFGLSNACEQYVHRHEVSKVMLYSHFKLLKEDYFMEKLKYLQTSDMKFVQYYMKMPYLEDATWNLDIVRKCWKTGQTWEESTNVQMLPSLSSCK